MVSRLNTDVPQNAEIEEFLFGATRIDLGPVRAPLRELQDNRCFYCHDRIRGPACVDHFIPWSRHPDDRIENLVVTDRRCNGDKRGFFASIAHLDRWKQAHLVAGPISTALAEVAERVSWERHPGKTETVARSLYRRLPADTNLWTAPGEFVRLDRKTLGEIFPTGDLDTACSDVRSPPRRA